MTASKHFPNIFDTHTEFFDLISGGKPVLGLDVGSKTIGIAISDTRQTLASPLRTLLRKKFTQDVETLATLIQKLNIAGIVIGLPLENNGKEGRMCQSIRQFARNLYKHHAIPILLQDERFSTDQAMDTLVTLKVTPTQRKQKVDSVAACLILQSALNQNHTNG